jgi:hypothetical protein
MHQVLPGESLTVKEPGSERGDQTAPLRLPADSPPQSDSHPDHENTSSLTSHRAIARCTGARHAPHKLAAHNRSPALQEARQGPTSLSQVGTAVRSDGGAHGSPLRDPPNAHVTPSDCNSPSQASLCPPLPCKPSSPPSAKIPPCRSASPQRRRRMPTRWPPSPARRVLRCTRTIWWPTPTGLLWTTSMKTGSSNPAGGISPLSERQQRAPALVWTLQTRG